MRLALPQRHILVKLCLIEQSAPKFSPRRVPQRSSQSPAQNTGQLFMACIPHMYSSPQVKGRSLRTSSRERPVPQSALRTSGDRPATNERSSTTGRSSDKRSEQRARGRSDSDRKLARTKNDSSSSSLQQKQREKSPNGLNFVDLRPEVGRVAPSLTRVLLQTNAGGDTVCPWVDRAPTVCDVVSSP